MSHAISGLSSRVCHILLEEARVTENICKLDRTRRKTSEICLRALPSTFIPTRSPDDALKPQIWPISAKGSIHRARPKCLETPNLTHFTKSK